MKRVRIEAEKCEYAEQDRWIKKQFYVALTMKACKPK